MLWNDRGAPRLISPETAVANSPLSLFQDITEAAGDFRIAYSVDGSQTDGMLLCWDRRPLHFDFGVVTRKGHQ
jgi:hypothetical protein